MRNRADELRAKLIRNLDAIATEREQREPLYDSQCARLAHGTAARKLGASIDTVAPGKRACPYHCNHAQEEMFVVLAGRGTLRVAGEMLPVAAGDVIFVPPGPEYPHQLINTSDAPLKFLSISTRDEVEIVEYPDSDKLLAYAPGLDYIAAKGADLDYWHGEP
jgi:uncharacterized cupin superfamily protein